MGEQYKVVRMPMDRDKITKHTMKMKSLNELWLIPRLQGVNWQIRSGNVERYVYLKEIDKKLMLASGSKKEEIIRKAIRVLENGLQASYWRGHRRFFGTIKEMI